MKVDGVAGIAGAGVVEKMLEIKGWVDKDVEEGEERGRTSGGERLRSGVVDAGSCEVVVSTKAFLGRELANSLEITSEKLEVLGFDRMGVRGGGGERREVEASGAWGG